MNNKTNNLQDIFLNNARKNKIGVIIHLMNGFQIKGMVTGFDSYTVVLDCDDKQMLIYKHAISSITPNTPILYKNETKGN